MINVASILEDSARNCPDKLCVVSGDDRVSYGELNRRADRIAGGIRASGVRAGDRVAMTCPNIAAFPAIYYAIIKSGAVVVPLNPLMKAREIEYMLNDSGAIAYICFEGTERLKTGPEGWETFKNAKSCGQFWLIETGELRDESFGGAETFSALLTHDDLIDGTARGGADDTCAILYTSGTTGKPKGAQLTHSNLLTNAVVTSELFDNPEDEVHLLFLPLFHAFAQGYHMNPAFLKGATIVMLPRFDPAEVLRVLKGEPITLFGGGPTMFWGIMHCPELQDFDVHRDATSLRRVFTAGQAMPLEQAKRFEQLFGVPVVELYGMTEVTIATCNPLHDVRRGLIGIPLRGAGIRVADPELNEVPPGVRGEIVMKGPYVTKGYLGLEEETEAAFRKGWFHSGDVAYRDEDGYLYSVDRIKDVIIRGGENIYPREIEEILVTHPAVSQAAVIGAADEKFGEEVMAFVVLRNGERISPEALVLWSKNQMAKYPRIVEIVESLPMGPTGKILKHELRKRV